MLKCVSIHYVHTITRSCLLVQFMRSASGASSSDDNVRPKCAKPSFQVVDSQLLRAHL